jgi:signal transduction histidine kinase
MDAWTIRKFPQSRPLVAGIALGFVVLVGIADYVTGFEITFSIFYLLPIILAAWFVGSGFAIWVAVLSVAVAVGGDIKAGETYSSRLVPVWNASITFVFYLLFVWLLMRLKSFQGQLEKKVSERTAALANEMATREKLEQELLSVSEREQQRIGNDLHDSLCQHLTSAALAGQVLEEKLAARKSPEIPDAVRVVELIEEGIELARSLARGLFPVLLDKQGLMSALNELAATTREISKAGCVFESDEMVSLDDTAKATHLFRIAQEAVRNAVKHSGARKIAIQCSEDEEGIRLEVRDDGAGIPGQSGEKHQGMGLQIMKHRAAMIGATLDIRSDAHGTAVTCVVSPENSLRKGNEQGHGK